MSIQYLQKVDRLAEKNNYYLKIKAAPVGCGTSIEVNPESLDGSIIADLPVVSIVYMWTN